MVYMTYSTRLEGGWAAPIALFKTPTMATGYDYNIHTYPGYDST